jgi:phage shock protein C
MTHLHRSSSNRVLFGVCGGLAERYGWDPTWVRLAFVLATFLGGPGVVAYLLMAIIVPRSRALSAWEPSALPRG